MVDDIELRIPGKKLGIFSHDQIEDWHRMAENPNSDVNSLPPEALAFATRMFDAARSGQIDVFQQALPAGLPATMTNDKGDSLVMLAAYHGHAPLVKLLIEHGANPNTLNDRGQSPLAGAVFKGEAEVVEALLDGGADPEHGAPSALEAVVLFKQEEKWKAKFEAAPGRGKAGSV